MSFQDFVVVQECKKTLEEYKLNRIDETECLKTLAHLFEELK